MSLAREAWRLGEAALASGELDAASAWLDRARRLAPEDPTVKLALATVWLRQGRPEASGLFEELASEHEVRAAWLGLAAARLAAGDSAAAARAVAKALSTQIAAIDPEFSNLAGKVAQARGEAGWCAVAGNGMLYVGLPPDAARAGPNRCLPVLMRLDGRRVRPRLLTASGVLPLPAGWDRAHRLEVAIGEAALLGSPIELARLRRTEGFVSCREGGIEGWAWLPADPETDPVLHIVPDGRRAGFSITATDATMQAEAAQLLARPRRFRIGPGQLAGVRGPLRVIGRDGRDLLGSPLDPGAERDSASRLASAIARRLPATGSPRPAVATPRLAAAPAEIVGTKPGTQPVRRRKASTRPASVIVPVYGHRALTLQCLEQVLATVPRGVRVIVVDDASPDPDLAADLDKLAARRTIKLLRNARNRGFPASANAGLRAAAGTDAILLNSDALVAEGWVERLRSAAYAAPDIGTATPFSNDATILSYPRLSERNAVPDLAGTRHLAALAHRANAGEVVDIPTAIGFCMYIRGDCLDAVGLFREDVFAQGYGEENDFCLRARHLGWRHVAACGVFVAHVGGQSFGAARFHLLARNLAMLNRLHPGYDALIADYVARDPLAAARRRFDIARWRAARARFGRHGSPAGSVLLITHDRGGGVQRQVAARIAALRADGLRPIVLSPVRRQSEPTYDGLSRLDDASGEAYPNLCFALPGDLPAMARFLRAEHVVRAELHHLLGHDHAVMDSVRPARCPVRRAHPRLRLVLSAHQFARRRPPLLRRAGRGDLRGVRARPRPGDRGRYFGDAFARPLGRRFGAGPAGDRALGGRGGAHRAALPPRGARRGPMGTGRARAATAGRFATRRGAPDLHRRRDRPGKGLRRAAGLRARRRRARSGAAVRGCRPHDGRCPAHRNWPRVHHG